MVIDSWLVSLERIDRLIRRLRGENGCVWDRAQTPESLTPYLIEEMHEALDALRQGSPEKVAEEIGDALYLWIFFLHLLEDNGRVSIADAVDAIEEKLIRRHPHVFAGLDTQTSRDPGQWERQKLRENGAERETIRPLPAGIPALLAARRIQEKAAAFGFDWKTPVEVLPKIREEIDELEAEIAGGSGFAAVHDELGDTFFALVNLSRHLGQDPEAALRAASEKFRSRFNEMVRSIEAAGHHLGDTPLDLMESHWKAVKDLDINANRPEDRP